jgi:5-methylcytosine-specific restriction endonuclease McrA
LGLIKQLRDILTEKNAYFLSVDKETWDRYKYLLILAVKMNKNYRPCVIYRKKYKGLTNFVVIGLKWNGKNVRRRTTGFAKEYIRNHPGCGCIYCGIPLTEQNATADHIIPVSKGGNNAQVNLVATCFECNNERGDMPFRKYMKVKESKYRGEKFI